MKMKCSQNQKEQLKVRFFLFLPEVITTGLNRIYPHVSVHRITVYGEDTHTNIVDWLCSQSVVNRLEFMFLIREMKGKKKIFENTDYLAFMSVTKPDSFPIPATVKKSLLIGWVLWQI